MRNCRKHLQISSQFLLRYATQKPFSSSSVLSSLVSPDPLISSNSTHFPNKFDQNASKTHQNSNILYQSCVVDVLVSIKNEPLCALDYYRWAEKQTDFKGKIESFCVLLHIAMSSGKKLDARLHKSLLKKLFSSFQGFSDVNSLIICLLDISDKFGFGLDSDVFNALLNGFVSINRIEVAVECLDWVIKNPIVDFGELYYHGLLAALCKKKKMREAEDLCDKMFLSGVFAKSGGVVCSRAINLMMGAYVEQGKVDKAENLFIKAKESGVSLNVKPYDTAIEIACMKPESSDAALRLLMEMKEKGLVASKWAFLNVVKACVREGKIREALVVRKAMRVCGKRLSLIVVISLIKGCFASGDLESALSLFERMPEDGLSPDEVTFGVLIEGCCRKGNVEKAGHLYDQMVEKGCRPTLHSSVLMIRGFLNSRRLKQAYEHYLPAETIPSDHNGEKNAVMADCVSGGKIDKGFRINPVAFPVIIDELFRIGKVDEAFKVFDEMNKSSVCGASTYNTILRWLCKLGQTSRARNLLVKFIQEGKFEPSCNTYGFIIEGFIKEGAIYSAMHVYNKMSENGVSPNEITCTILVKGLCKINNLDRALNLREEMLNKGLKFDVSVNEALIDGLWKRKETKKAYVLVAELLDAGLTPDKKIYNRMIAYSGDIPPQQQKNMKKKKKK